MKSDIFGYTVGNTASDTSALLAREREWLLQEKYGGVESEAFHIDCERLAAGEPLGYVIGQVPFLDCTIWLDSHPLIPRPETEYWVDKAIDEIKKIMPLDYKKNSPAPLVTESLGRQWREHVLPPSISVLDLCAGSGAIGVAIAKAIPGAYVTFAEIDLAHLPTIKKNLQKNCPLVASQIETLRIIESDLFEHVEGQFDFILTNPPYIDRETHTVEDSVVLHEPHLALFGGKGGMEVIARIIKAARAKLAPPSPHLPHGGQLWIEHEPFQSEAIAILAHKHGLTCATHPDQYDTPRYSVFIVA